MLRRICLLTAIFILAGITSKPLLAYETAQETMSVYEVEVGMRGYGKTVVTGRKIETFDIEVLGILHNNKINESLLINGRSILVKVSGDVIKRAGGIAAGMSGSPVYINDRLIGGLSSGWLLTDHTVGLVTPIDEMLEIWKYPDIASLPRDQQKSDSSSTYIWKSDKALNIGKASIDTIYEIDAGVHLPKNLKANETIFARTAGPIYAQGMTPRAAKIFSERMGGRNVVVSKNTILNFQDSYETDKINDAAEAFEPGSALAIQLTRGDISMATLGTMTHRNGNKILALAHPFLKKGSVSFLMTGAYIHHSFSSVQMPFKIGAPTEMLGIITQDREKGVGGILGKLPDMIPISIDIFDKDLQVNKSINFQIVKDQSLFTSVLESAMVQAIEGVTDRIGPGTARMSIALDCVTKAGENHSFRRENMFYSKTDIVQSLVTEVTNLMTNVVESEFEEVMPTRLILKIEVEQKRRTMHIEKVEVKNTSISGGGVLDVDVVLKPFRETKFIRRVKLPIPQDIGKENLILSVYGLTTKIEDADSIGAVGSENRESKTVPEQQAGEEPPEGFEATIRSWVNSPKNSDILFQLAVEGDESKKLLLNGKDIEIQPTNLFVTGCVDTTLTLSEE